MNRKNLVEIPDFPGYYINIYGDVYSAYVRGQSNPRKKLFKKAITINKYGYKYVTLSKEKILYKKLIHSLLLEVFIGPRPNGLVCRHLDANKTNNDLSNICYGTYSQNQMDRVVAGNSNRGEQHGMHKYNSEFVLVVRELAKHMFQREVAVFLGIPKSTVSHLVTQDWRHIE